MSDFDGSMIARSPKEWVASMYLSSQQRVIDDLYKFLSYPLNSGDRVRGKRTLKASAWSLFFLCRSRMKGDKVKKFDPEEIQEYIISEEDDNLLKAILMIFDYLETDLKLTDIANIQNFDRKNIYKSNKLSGYN